MKRPALYSSAPRSTSAPVAGGAARVAGHAADGAAGATTDTRHGDADAPSSAAGAPGPGLVRRLWHRYDRVGLLLAGVVIALLVLGVRDHMRPAAPPLTQKDIDSAVLHTLETKALPSRAARAAAIVAPSVVRVQQFDGEDNDEPGAGEVQQGVGSGVVIVDSGLILTNLHVVAGARRIVVTFHDGFETEADLVRPYPEKDLAVIKAKKLPDDLQPATLGTTADLKPGDDVVAVGFPFGIGPSVSAGVVSGLDRNFRSPEGKRVISGLIQFDAAANPGNSGGPLITMSGEVVGIVTAILNPTPARTFIGIGFATTIESAGAAVGLPPF